MPPLQPKLSHQDQVRAGFLLMLEQVLFGFQGLQEWLQEFGFSLFPPNEQNFKFSSNFWRALPHEEDLDSLGFQVTFNLLNPVEPQGTVFL